MAPLILPVAAGHGEGDRREAVVEGPKGCTTPDGVGPSVSGFAAATSPSLRDREECYVRFSHPKIGPVG